MCLPWVKSYEVNREKNQNVQLYLQWAELWLETWEEVRNNMTIACLSLSLHPWNSAWCIISNRMCWKNKPFIVLLFQKKLGKSFRSREVTKKNEPSADKNVQGFKFNLPPDILSTVHLLFFPSLSFFFWLYSIQEWISLGLSSFLFPISLALLL